MAKRERVFLAAAVVLLVLLEVLGRLVFLEGTWFPTAEIIVSRLLGAAVFLVLIRRMGYRVFRLSPGKGSAAVLIPALLVALNNLPLLGLLTGRAEVRAAAEAILLFFVECAAVGVFEELAFRGFLLPYCLERCRRKPQAVFRAAVLSSAVFGLVHLVNLFSGGSPGAVFMQVGYSFLIGGMCACVLLACRSVWVCAAIHAVYNFCGTLVSRLGSGNGWDPATVTATVLLGILTAVLLFRFLLTYEEAAARDLWEGEK